MTAERTQNHDQNLPAVHRDDVQVLCLCKGEERYMFLWTGANRGEMLRTLGRFASEAELSFTWYDAAVAAKKVREMGSC